MNINIDFLIHPKLYTLQNENLDIQHIFQKNYSLLYILYNHYSFFQQKNHTKYQIQKQLSC